MSSTATASSTFSASSTSASASASESSDEFELYHYNPTLVGGIIFAIIFGALLIGFITKLVISSTRTTMTSYVLEEEQNSQMELSSYDQAKYQRFSTVSDTEEGRKFGRKPKSVKKFIFGAFVPMIVGVFLEFVGYICRCVGHFSRQSLIAYCIQSIFLLVAPSLIAASIYMIFGRMLSLLNAQKYSYIPVKYLTTFFVCGDILSFLIQAGGGGLMAKSDSVDTGSKIVVGGLGIQLLFFGFFVFSEISFSVKIRSEPTSISSGLRNSRVAKGFLAPLTNWRSVNISLIISSLLIIVRCVVRLIEFIQGFNGFLITHEVFIYTCDGLLVMFACCDIFASQPELVLAELSSYVR